MMPESDGKNEEADGVDARADGDALRIRVLDEFDQFWFLRILGTPPRQGWQTAEHFPENLLSAAWTDFLGQPLGELQSVAAEMDGLMRKYGNWMHPEFKLTHNQALLLSRVAPSTDRNMVIDQPAVVWINASSGAQARSSARLTESGWDASAYRGKVGRATLTFRRHMRFGAARWTRVAATFGIEVRGDRIVTPGHAERSPWRIVDVVFPSTMYSGTCWIAEADPFVLTMWVTRTPEPGQPNEKIELPISWASQGNDDRSGDFTLLVAPDSHTLEMTQACELSRKYFSLTSHTG